MFPRMTSPVARFMIGWRVPRVKILLVNLAKNPNSRADVAATWHSFLVTMSSLLVTIITFGYYIRLLRYVPSPAPERTLSSGRPGCARGCFMRAGRLGPASTTSYCTILKTIFYSPRPSNLRRAIQIIIPMARRQLVRPTLHHPHVVTWGVRLQSWGLGNINY